jgi:hypothetical protein
MPSSSEKDVNHGDRAHAPFSPSSTDRFLVCPAAVPLSEKLRETGSIPCGSSKHTRRGEAGHELAEIHLAAWTNPEPDTDKTITIHTRDGDPSYDSSGMSTTQAFKARDLVPYVQPYLDAVREAYHDEMLMFDKEDVTLFVEERIDIVPPDCYGTSDAVIVTPETLHVFDLKCGDGKIVSAEWNKQLMSYAAGWCAKYDWQFCEVHLHIVQRARGDHDLDPHSIFICSTDDLKEHMKVLKEAIKKSQKVGGSDGAGITGDHCHWCPAQSVCPAQQSLALRAAQQIFEDDTDIADATLEPKDPVAMSDAQLQFILRNAKVLRGFVDAVEAHVAEKMMNGEDFAGYKIIEGRSSRTWNPNMEDDEVAAALDSAGCDPYKEKLIGITEAEKQIGKAEMQILEIDGIIMKPSGAPKVVPMSHKSPPMDRTLMFKGEDIDD